MATRSYSDATEVHALRQLGVDHLNRRVGKTFRRWKTDLREDYGEIGERRLHRVMQWLVKNGLVRRSEVLVCDEEWDEGGHMCHEYFRVADAAPVIRTVESCGLCGAVGVTRKSHISWHMHRYLRHAASARQRHIRPDAYEAIEFGLPSPSPRAPQALSTSAGGRHAAHRALRGAREITDGDDRRL